MQGIRLLVSFALIIVPAAGVLCALRARERRLAALAAIVLVASVAVASFTVRGTHRPDEAAAGASDLAVPDLD